MRYRSLQSSDEAALAMLRYRCRNRPQLKLSSPESCEAYLARWNRNPMALAPSLAVQCRDCPGPVEIDGGQQKPSVTSTEFEPGEKEMASTRASRNRQYGKPTVCRTCGLAVGTLREDGTEVSFYPSRADECKRCIVEKTERNKRKAEKVSSLGTETSAVQEEAPANPYPYDPEQELRAALEEMDRYPDIPGGLPEEAESSDGYRYQCPIHGPHNGYSTGGRHSNGCPICGNQKRANGMAAHNLRMSQLAAIRRRFPFLEQYLEERIAGECLDCSPYELMARIVIEQIPDGWFRTWALRGIPAAGEETDRPMGVRIGNRSPQCK